MAPIGLKAVVGESKNIILVLFLLLLVLSSGLSFAIAAVAVIISAALAARMLLAVGFVQWSMVRLSCAGCSSVS